MTAWVLGEKRLSGCFCVLTILLAFLGQFLLHLKKIFYGVVILGYFS